MVLILTNIGLLPDGSSSWMSIFGTNFNMKNRRLNRHNIITTITKKEFSE